MSHATQVKFHMCRNECTYRFVRDNDLYQVSDLTSSEHKLFFTWKTGLEVKFSCKKANHNSARQRTTHGWELHHSFHRKFAQCEQGVESCHAFSLCMMQKKWMHFFSSQTHELVHRSQCSATRTAGTAHLRWPAVFCLVFVCPRKNNHCALRQWIQAVGK